MWHREPVPLAACAGRVAATLGCRSTPNVLARTPVRIRLLTPLLLLVVLGVVVFEPWLPGRAWFEGLLGPNAVLRSALVATLGCLLLLWGESFRLHTMLTGLLAAMRQFRDGMAAPPAAAQNPQARLEAVRLLVAAMASADPAVRQSCRQNLLRLVGQDLGDDPAAWQAWLERQAGSGGGAQP